MIVTLTKHPDAPECPIYTLLYETFDLSRAHRSRVVEESSSERDWSVRFDGISLSQVEAITQMMRSGLRMDWTTYINDREGDRHVTLYVTAFKGRNWKRLVRYLAEILQAEWKWVKYGETDKKVSLEDEFLVWAAGKVEQYGRPEAGFLPTNEYTYASWTQSWAGLGFKDLAVDDELRLTLKGRLRATEPAQDALGFFHQFVTMWEVENGLEMHTAHLFSAYGRHEAPKIEAVNGE